MTDADPQEDVQYQPMIRDIPESERPRERLKHYGAGALSTSELLAILLRTGVHGENVIHLAMRILSEYGGLSGLAKASFSELEATKGIGPAKVTQLKAAFELGRRLLVSRWEFMVRRSYLLQWLLEKPTDILSTNSNRER